MTVMAMKATPLGAGGINGKSIAILARFDGVLLHLGHEIEYLKKVDTSEGVWVGRFVSTTFPLLFRALSSIRLEVLCTLLWPRVLQYYGQRICYAGASFCGGRTASRLKIIQPSSLQRKCWSSSAASSQPAATQDGYVVGRWQITSYFRRALHEPSHIFGPALVTFSSDCSSTNRNWL